MLDEEPLAPPPLLDLADFVASHYLAPPGECFKLVMPPAGVRASRAVVRLRPVEALAGDGRAGADDPLLKALARGPLRLSVLAKRLGGDPQARLARLKKAGLVDGGAGPASARVPRGAARRAQRASRDAEREGAGARPRAARGRRRPGPRRGPGARPAVAARRGRSAVRDGCSPDRGGARPPRPGRAARGRGRRRDGHGRPGDGARAHPARRRLRRLPPLPAARGDGQRQDRGLPAGGRGDARTRPRRDPAGARRSA